jgi:hypothetical protein
MIEVIRRISQKSFCQPRTVVFNLNKHDIADFSNPELDRWKRWANQETKEVTEDNRNDNDDSNGSDVSSGLGSMIN